MQYKTQQIITYILCYVQYTSTHCVRQMWSLTSGKIVDSQPSLVEDFTKNFLSWINFGFLFIYGMSMLTIGRLGDQMNTKTFLLIGQFSTAAVAATLGFTFAYESKHRYFIMILMFINGITQSTGWPGVITIVDNWFPSKRNKIILMGAFASCSNVGNLIADLIFALSSHIEVYIPMQIAFLYILAISLINFLVLQHKPNFDQIEIIEEKIDREQEQHGLSLLEAIKVPNAVVFANAFGLVKSSYYILGLWLPQYFDGQTPPVNNPTLVVSMLDFGSIPGGVIVCAIGYYVDMRASVIIPFLIGGTLVELGINYLHISVDGPYIALVFFTGLFIGGVYNNIVGGISQELGHSVGGNSKSVATLTSLVEGYGSVFAAFNQLVVPYVDNILLLYCAFLDFLCILLLLPMFVNEIQRRYKKQEFQDYRYTQTPNQVILLDSGSNDQYQVSKIQ